MGRRILLLSVAKAISMLIETIEVESRFPARANTTTDTPRDLFPTVTCVNVSWTSFGVALLVGMARLGKSSQTFLYFFGGRLARAHDVLNRTEILVEDSVLMMMKYKDGYCVSR